MTVQTVMKTDRENIVDIIGRLPDGVILQVKEYIERIYEENRDDRKITAVRKFLANVAAIKDEDNVLTDSDWDELADIRSQTNLTRKIEI